MYQQFSVRCSVKMQLCCNYLQNKPQTYFNRKRCRQSQYVSSLIHLHTSARFGGCFALTLFKAQVCTFHDGCKQGIDQQIFNRKSISRKITHPQSSFYLNKDWGWVILRKIDFLLQVWWSIPCLHPSWKVHTWIEICASLKHRKKTKADGSRLIPRKHTETLVLLSVVFNHSFLSQMFKNTRMTFFFTAGTSSQTISFWKTTFSLT